MKKPLFNQTERRIIYEGKTIYASIMKLHIIKNQAKKKIEKEFMKTYVGRFIEKIANYLVTILS